MKLGLSKLFSNDRALMVFSLFLALVCWFVVAFTVDTETSVSVENVPVDLSTQSSVLSSLDLHAIDAENIQVDVHIRGDRLVVGSISKDDIRIIPDLSRVTRPGTVEIPLTAVNNTNQHFEIISVSPATLTVKFDRLLTKSLPIWANINGLSVDDDFVVESETISPAAVTISGPEIDVDKISSCIVNIDVDEKLQKTTSFESDVIFLDKEGNVVESEFIVADVTTAEVVVPVKKITVLPLVVDFINVPSGFPMEELSYSLSNSNIKIAGNPDVLSRYSEIKLGYIDMKTLDFSQNYTFDISLPSGFTNIDHLKTVEVVFDETNIGEGIFTINAFSIKNRPSSYNVQITTTRLTNVRILGDQDIIATLSSDDIIAEIDLSERNIQPGQFSVPLKIYMPTKGFVWAVGDYTAIINVKEA
ncbi:MAG: hypothetical protein IKU72_00480 [Oscillospiraceae bacterium]|nr:hypothetical protein [Oscillospiraceae bacterium]